jgi:hypothetical protein
MIKPRIPVTLALTCLLALGIALPVSAQLGRDEAKNLLQNGGFEKKAPAADNLLDGINSNNEFQIEQIRVPVVGTGGGLGRANLPPSVAMVDLNKDGKTDVVAASPIGFYYVYFNQGENPGEPKFTHAEIMPLFLSAGRNVQYVLHSDYEYRAPRIGFGSLRNEGAMNMIVGNLFGELFLIDGQNSPSRVAYEQPRELEDAMIPTTNVEGRYWGNLFSPNIGDFIKGDSMGEIVMGEGSYSANSVFLLRQSQNTYPPKYADEDRFYLVVGEGREQLVPALVDANNDGLLDVLVSDKVGKITLHFQPEGYRPEDGPLNTLEDNPGITLEIGGKERLGTATTVATGDYNMDGLFDLLLGQGNGKIAVAVNSGSPGEPKFEKLEVLKGEDLLGKETMSEVPDWDIGLDRVEGNALGYWKVMNAEEEGEGLQGISPPEGNQVLAGRMFEGWNRVIQPNITPTIADRDIYYHVNQPYTFKTGQRYTLELEAKGNRVDEFTMWAFGRVRGKITGRVEQGRRGEVEKGQRVQNEFVQIIDKSSVGPTWRSYRWTFVAEPENRALRDQVESMDLKVGIYGILNEPDSELYIDNVRLTRDDRR